jgi:broad specificity phosphatase PhoE
MKILFLRHGESVDDIENRYGGWSDYPLTPKGEKQILTSTEKVRKLNENFQIILTSPLQRAVGAAQILSKGLGIPFEVFEFIKERNSYGILSGMNKEEAFAKYPEIVKKLNKGKYIYGSERYEDLVERVKKSIELLKKDGRDMIVVSHGNFLKCIFKEVVGRKLIGYEDGGFSLTKVGKKIRIIKSDGFEVKT